MAALDLIGRRWALQIVWTLSQGPLGFRELKAQCKGISPTMLSTRLKELRRAGIVEYDCNEKNRLTEIGQELFWAVGSLKTWSARWEQVLNKGAGRKR